MAARPSTDPMVMSNPSPCARIVGKAARFTRRTPNTLRSEFGGTVKAEERHGGPSQHGSDGNEQPLALRTHCRQSRTIHAEDTKYIEIGIWWHCKGRRKAWRPVPARIRW